MSKLKTKTTKPANKVIGMTLAYAIVIIIIQILESKGATLDDELKNAITVIVTFLIGYIVPPAEEDSVVESLTKDSSK